MDMLQLETSPGIPLRTLEPKMVGGGCWKNNLTSIKFFKVLTPNKGVYLFF